MIIDTGLQYRAPNRDLASSAFPFRRLESTHNKSESSVFRHQVSTNMYSMRIAPSQTCRAKRAAFPVCLRSSTLRHEHQNTVTHSHSRPLQRKVPCSNRTYSTRLQV